MTAGVADGARRLAARLVNFPSPRAQRFLLVVAAAVFAVGAYLTASRLDVTTGDMRWWALAVAACIGIPLSALVNGLEFSTSARVIGQRVPLLGALRTTIVATAVNYLPAHGGSLVRIQGLRQGGSRYRKATSATALMGMAWVGWAGLLAGVWMLGTARLLLAGGFLAMGVVGLAVATGLLLLERHDFATAARLGVRISVVELASVIAVAIRYYLVMYGLGFDALLSGAILFALAAVIASATGLVPGGLGFRELLAGVFAPAVGLPATVGFAVTAVDRVLGLIVHAVLALLLLRVSRHHSKRKDEPVEVINQDEASLARAHEPASEH